MAPRTPESREDFIARLRKQVAGGAAEVRFGMHHFSHAVCEESDAWRVRRLACSTEDAEAYMKEHGMFMPEHAEQLAKPTVAVMEAPSLDELIALMEAHSWPF